MKFPTHCTKCGNKIGKIIYSIVEKRYGLKKHYCSWCWDNVIKENKNG